MEQVFFRLHVRFVTTVTRLLSPKTRRVLEYVTLANAFVLVVSLAWLHTRFVNPKGGRGSAVSCLPAALERAGVDPAQLHVLQIHIRLPPDDRGGIGSGVSGHDNHGGSGAILDPQRHSGGGGGDGDGSRRARDGAGGVFAGSYDDSSRLSDLVDSNDDGGGCGKESAAAPAAAADSCADAPPGVSSRAAGTATPVNGGSAGASLGLESPPSSPEIFYSMKLVTGKDAVGTLSGPGTLGIERCTARAGEAGGVSAEEGSGGGAACGAAVEDKRSTVVKTLMDVFFGGKGREAATRTRVAAAGKGERDAGSSPAGGKSGHRIRLDGGEGLLERGARAPPDAPTAACAAAAGETAAWSDDLNYREPYEEQRGGADVEESGEGEGGGEQRLQDEVYLYSLEKGFLMLRPDLRRKHGIVTANVTISAHDPCLGGMVVQAMVKDFVGYDTVVMNWLISLYGGRGFLYGVHNNELFNLNYAAEFIESTEDMGKFLVFKIGVLFTTLFLFFTTTTLVSFTLRETQERMLKFTFLLQHHVRHRLPYAPLIFTHVVESLVFVPIMVGILFFLFEFFSDQLLAFMVLSVVWLCEVYSVVSVRTSVCIRFFPQVFFLYFTLFHIYFFSFPFGFSYLALVTTVLFLQHSMLFCWNRYEVPALRSGVISAARPRQAGMVIGVVPRYDPHGMVLPPAPRPGSGSGGGGGGGGVAGVPAWGRQRAATASSLDQRSEWHQPVVPATRMVGRVIPRSNSSPDPAPTTSSRPFGSIGDGGGGASAASAVEAASPGVPPAIPPLETEGPPTPASRPPAAPERPLPRRWGDGNGSGSGASSGSGGGGGGDGGGGGGCVGGGGSGAGVNSVDGSAGDSTTNNNVSAPLLGSFPFSLRNTGARTAAPGLGSEVWPLERDSSSGGGTSSSTSSLRPGGGIGGVRLETVSAGDESEGQAVTGKSAPVGTTHAAVVLDRSRVAVGPASASGVGAGGPAATTNPLGGSTSKSVVEAAAVPAKDARGAAATVGQAGGRSLASRPVDEADATAKSPPPRPSHGPADGAGLVFGRGGHGQQQQQAQQQQQLLRTQECLQQEQELLRREDNDSFRFGLGGTQRWSDDDGGNSSSGRASPPMGERW
eukprot:g6580.t1